METAALDAGRAVRERAGSGVEILARLGYAAKGIVYVGVGVLTAIAAFGAGSGSASGSRDALARIGQQSWGTVLLALIAPGIAGYVVWRMVQVFKDPERRGSDLKGLATRAVLFLSGVLYAGLGFWVVKGLVDGGGSGVTAQGAGGGADSWSASLLQQPYGAWVLGLFGAGVVAYGVAEWVKAHRASFEKRLRHDLSGTARRTVRKVARAGLVSRGIVFFVVGGFFVYAAWTRDPSQARGLEGALETLGGQSYGPWLMGLVALGLAAYGALQVVKAWYRRIGPVRVGSGDDVGGGSRDQQFPGSEHWRR